MSGVSPDQWSRTVAAERGETYKRGRCAATAFGLGRAHRVSNEYTAIQAFLDADELLPPASLTRDEAKELARMEVEP